MNTSRRIINLIPLFFLSLLFSNETWAATIQQVKNGKVLISLEGTKAAAGDQFIGMNAANKKTSLIEISSVKGDRAVGKIIKGTSQPNDTVTLKGAGGGRGGSSPAAPEEKMTSNPLAKNGFIRHDMRKLAVNVKMSTDLISTLQQDNNTPTPNKETVDMKGSNVGVNVSLDLPMGKTIYLRGYLGYEMLKVAGTSVNLVCDAKLSRDCNVDINYVTFGGLVRLNYSVGSFAFWAGAGAGFKQPLSKKSSALTLDNIALANSAVVALGIDYHINNKVFIPVGFEYHKSFNESETVPKIENMGVEVGLGFLF